MNDGDRTEERQEGVPEKSPDRQDEEARDESPQPAADREVSEGETVEGWVERMAEDVKVAREKLETVEWERRAAERPEKHD